MITRVLDSVDILSIRYSFVKESLIIEFHDGEILQFIDVPDEIYFWIIDAFDPFEYYNEYIRDAYDYERIDLDDL